MTPFELTTSISNGKELDEKILAPYQGIYLGNAFCAEYEGNFLADFSALKRGVTQIKSWGKRAYLCTPAAPLTPDLPQVEKILLEALKLPVDAIEVHSYGVMRMAQRLCPRIPLHLGGLSNLYTGATANIVKSWGVKRVTPNYELSLEDMTRIQQESQLPVELLLHGKMPLGISEKCFLLNYQEESKLACPQICQEDFWLESRGWELKTYGLLTLSGKDVCMIEHLPLIWQKGFRTFRVEAISEKPLYRQKVGEIYCQALQAVTNGNFKFTPPWSRDLKSLSAKGLCNGFYFGQAGKDYVGQLQK
jgi:putative protease